jgi:hypothetical protein
MRDLQTGYGLIAGFIAYLHTTCYCTSQTTAYDTLSSQLLRLPSPCRAQLSINCSLGTLLYNHLTRTEQKTPPPTIPLLCLPIRCLETGSSIVACALISAGSRLLSRCLALNYSGFQASCHNIHKFSLLSPYIWVTKSTQENSKSSRVWRCVVEVYRRFRRMYCIHLQDRRVCRTSSFFVRPRKKNGDRGKTLTSFQSTFGQPFMKTYILSARSHCADKELAHGDERCKL